MLFNCVFNFANFNILLPLIHFFLFWPLWLSILDKFVLTNRRVFGFLLPLPIWLAYSIIIVEQVKQAFEEPCKRKKRNCLFVHLGIKSMGKKERSCCWLSFFLRQTDCFGSVRKLRLFLSVCSLLRWSLARQCPKPKTKWVDSVECST